MLAMRLKETSVGVGLARNFGRNSAIVLLSCVLTRLLNVLLSFARFLISSRSVHAAERPAKVEVSAQSNDYDESHVSSIAQRVCGNK
jgi:hypothetical protein